MEKVPFYHRAELLESVKGIARQAGSVILAIYHEGGYEEYTKTDDTPVTSADYASNEVLTKALAELTPKIPIISEEMAPVNFAQRKLWPCYWLLDPLDGTQEFISRSGYFAVNIALVENGCPVLGVIYWPTEDTLYFAVKGRGAFKQTAVGEVLPIRAQRAQDDCIRVAMSRVQTFNTVTQFLYDDTKMSFEKYGSCALKSCFVAEGLADCYLRVGPTGEWDTGAPQIIVEEAGGQILDGEFKPLSYNQRESLKNPDFLVLGDSSITWKEIFKPHPTTRHY
jgi:3'(2'), 5'-bisphosphate nucleotidase